MEHEHAIQNLAVECYLLGEMSPAEREAFEEHYFECAVCAEDVRAASRFLEDAREIWAEQQRPAPVLEAREQPKSPFWSMLDWLQPRIAAPAIAGLLIVIAIGVQRWSDVTAPRVVSTATLRAQTRGEAAVVSASEGQPVILRFDLPETPPTVLQFVVRSSDGAIALRTSGSADPGGEVTLLIPRFELSPGLYTLTVENSRELASYPFEVKRP